MDEAGVRAHGGRTVLRPAVAVAVVVLAAVGAVAGAERASAGAAVTAALVLPVAAVLVALVALARSGQAPALAVAAVAALLPLWSGLPPVPGPAAAAVLATPPVLLAAASHLLPGGRGHRLVVLLAGAAVAVHVLGYDPFGDPGCVVRCRSVETLAGSVVAPRQAVAGAAALTVAAAVLLLLRAASARHARPALAVGASAAGAVLAVSAVARVSAWTGPATAADRFVPPLLALAAVAAGALGLALARRRVHRQLARLLEHLEAGEPPVALDGVRAVHYALPDAGGWIDADGGRVDEPAAQGTVELPPGQAVLRIVPWPGADVGPMADRLTAADLVLLSNARSSAVTRAHQREVRDSQRRIVALADAERRRVERDLHDGTQQRLVTAKLHLRIAAGQLADTEPVQRAEAEVQQALERLRALSHGLFPRELAEEGLAAALEELLSASGSSTDLSATLRAEPAADAALAAYALVSALLPVARAVRVTCDDVALRVEVDLDDSGTRVRHDALVDVRDRVGAAGGHLREVGSGSDRAVVLELPCGS